MIPAVVRVMPVRSTTWASRPSCTVQIPRETLPYRERVRFNRYPTRA